MKQQKRRKLRVSHISKVNSKSHKIYDNFYDTLRQKYKKLYEILRIVIDEKPSNDGALGGFRNLYVT